jgi:hypothetical protein
MRFAAKGGDYRELVSTLAHANAAPSSWLPPSRREARLREAAGGEEALMAGTDETVRPLSRKQIRTTASRGLTDCFSGLDSTPSGLCLEWKAVAAQVNASISNEAIGC